MFESRPVFWNRRKDSVCEHRVRTANYWRILSTPIQLYYPRSSYILFFILIHSITAETRATRLASPHLIAFSCYRMTHHERGKLGATHYISLMAWTKLVSALFQPVKEHWNRSSQKKKKKKGGDGTSVAGSATTYLAITAVP